MLGEESESTTDHMPSGNGVASVAPRDASVWACRLGAIPDRNVTMARRPTADGATDTVGGPFEAGGSGPPVGRWSSEGAADGVGAAGGIGAADGGGPSEG